jgi:hypothetical protein
MFFNEGAGIKPAAGVFPITWSDERSGELPHLEVKVGKIPATTGADGGDLVAALNGRPGLNQHLFDMSVVRLHVNSDAILEEGVQDDDDVAPARTTVPGEEHLAVGHGIDRII